MELKDVLGERGEAAFRDTIRCVHPLIHAARSKNSLHAELVLNSCVIACNVAQEIGSIKYPPVAYGLCRCVLEIAAGADHLARNPEKVERFLQFGKWQQCEMTKPFDESLSPPLPDHLEIGNSFKREMKNSRGYPTWHGLTQTGLISDMVADGRKLFGNTSAFVHGDALISMAAMAYSPKHGWQAQLFIPMPLDYRVPVQVAISICADLLFAVNEILQLGCDDVMRRLDENKRVLGLANEL